MRVRFKVALWLWVVLAVSALPQLLAAQTATQQAPRTIDPLRFEKDMAAFDAEDKASMPPAGAIVITGSSSVRRWHPTIKQDLAPLTIVPRGFGGSTMQDALHWIERLTVPYKPRAVVVYEGDNDTGTWNVPAEKIVAQFEEIVARIHKALPQTRIYVISIKPSVSRWATWPEAVKANQMLKALPAKDKLVTYIDVATPMLQPNGQVMTDIFVEDNLHLNEKGYKIWTEAVRAVLIPAEAKHERSTN
jgi:lysophospholipase L1-like esterase